MLVAQLSSSESSVGRLAAQGLGDLEVAPGGGVEAQIGAVALGGEGGDVGQGLALGGAGVVEQRAAAARATGISSAPKPARSRVPKWAVSRRRAVSASNCQSASRRRLGASCSSSGRRRPSGISTSAGRRRSNWAASCGASHSSTRKSPLARLSQPGPARRGAG
jgi:hypothetical protein